ncbi:hypothetical protein FRC12_006576 [Ceratobasidium sp. 428]|nr:hypothetical protein FRC12_006576 [Ceratobasidium sp. 428]
MIRVGCGGEKNLKLHIGRKRCLATQQRRGKSAQVADATSLTDSGVPQRSTSSIDHTISSDSVRLEASGLQLLDLSSHILPVPNGSATVNDQGANTFLTNLTAIPRLAPASPDPTSAGFSLALSEQVLDRTCTLARPQPREFLAEKSDLRIHMVDAHIDSLTNSDKNDIAQNRTSELLNKDNLVSPYKAFDESTDNMGQAMGLIHQAGDVLDSWLGDSPGEIETGPLQAMSVHSTTEQSTANEAEPRQDEIIQAPHEELPTPSVLYLCKGAPLTFPPECSPYTSYPFQLHANKDLPWDIRIERGGDFRLISSLCQSIIETPGHKACTNCEEIPRTQIVQGIMQRAKFGAHGNTPRDYLPTSALLETIRRKTEQVHSMCLQSLAQARKVASLARQMDDYKRLTMAIGSGKVERVHALVSVALRGGAAAHGILDLYEKAASGLYKPHGYSQQETLRTLLLLKLGGARVAEVAHRLMSTPFVSTVRKYAPVAALKASPSTPTLDEVEHNIDVACASLLEVTPESPEDPIEGYVEMFDEMKLLELLRWDPDTNKILGICREHCPELACLEFHSIDQVLALFDKVNKGEVHLGTEATVAAIGLLSSDSHRSSARPVLLSSTCKREKADAHAKLINTLTTACKNKIDIPRKARLYCIASDGELRRGSALVEITMQHPLPLTSRIYPLVSPLPLMNHLVGDDDVTCDKDYKHVFKRFRNTLLREGGMLVLGTLVTPALIRLHLSENGMPPTRINFLLDPNDRQDVPLALSLLRAIWSLPSPRYEDKPSYAVVRRVLNVLGVLFRLLVTPYTNVELDLSSQLSSLSAAVHLCLILFRTGAAQSRFVPIPLYLDTAIMVKNVFYSVAKSKVDNPNGNFWLVLLGTDRLETCFGLLRTMIGSDSSADMLQLATRLSNVNICANILAEHPEWGGISRRLKLPPMESQPNLDVSAAFDHISPRVWKGDVSVGSVSLSASWQRGRELLASLVPGLAVQEQIQELDQSFGTDIFSPCGQLLVRSSQLCALDEEPQIVAQPIASQPVLDYQPVAEQELDIEDTIAISRAENEPGHPAPYVTGPNGMKVHKARLLRDSAMYTTLRNSKDRLSRIAGRSCYKPPTQTTDIESHLVTHSSLFGRPQLLLNDPATTLVQCQSHVFLSVVHIVSIKSGSRLLGKIPVDLLQKEDVTLTFQILQLMPILEPIPELASQKLDWSWSREFLPAVYKCPGRFVQTIDPTLSVGSSHQPTYIFKSSELQAIAASLYLQLNADDKRRLPVVPQSDSFPYSLSSECILIPCTFKRLDTVLK